MKKLFKLTALASAVFLLGACADETVLNPEQAREAAPESNAIQFGTYMGKSIMTRAGVTGSYTTDYLKGYKGGTWNSTQAQNQGFGVFAYYTGTYTYGQYQNEVYATETSGPSTPQKKEANFMFNQLVWWNNDAPADLITKWTYSPIKYWPNEVLNAAGNNDVDDQNNDTSNDPATAGTAGTTLENGGNVSFFAYAPYVALSGTAITGDGITAINKQGTLSASNVVTGDPIISYKLPTTAGNKAVDLLWGTAGVNGAGVTGAANAGVQGDGITANDRLGTAPSYTYTTYVASILDKYRTNADLTKQTTGGTIEFAFKHALAKIGGSYTGTGVGDDEDGTTPTNGLLVILDLDDLKGGESGGSLEQYLSHGDLEGSSKAEWNKYNTKVTINELVIESNQELTSAGATALQNNVLTFTTTAANFTDLKNSGDFNLATGQWSNITASGTTAYQQTVVPSASDPGSGSYGSGSGDDSKDAIISEELAEPNTTPATSKAGFEGIPIGVTTVAKNVYESEANPLVFIPGTMPIITFTITYTVRTYDPNLKNSYTEVKQKIKKNLYITEKVELNKQYNILMHLGLTSVKFTATVSDWDITDAIGTTTDPGAGQSPVTVYEDEVEHVYLPINVGEPTSVAATVAANSTNANLTSKAFTVGSAEVAIGTVDAMTATFPGEASAKPVEMSHVTMQAVDDKGNLVDWITYAYDGVTDKGTITVKDNISPKDRTAKIHIIYDGVADEYTITQYGVKVQAGFTVNVYTDAAKTVAATLTALPSASTKYYTTLTASYLHANKDDGEVSGTPTAFPNNPITSGFTITAGDITTVNGTTFTTKQYSTSSLSPSDRTESSKTTVTYDGVDVELSLTQKAPELNSIALTIGGATSQNVSATATTSGTIAVVAKFKDSVGKDAGSVTVPNSSLENTKATGKWAVLSSEAFATYTNHADNLEIGANSTGSIRSTEITIDYNNGTKTSNKVVITQSK